MNRFRNIGVLVAMLGAGVIGYSLLDFLGIHLGGESAGIGAIPNLTTYLGMLLLAVGIVGAIMSEHRPPK